MSFLLENGPNSLLCPALPGLRRSRGNHQERFVLFSLLLLRCSVRRVELILLSSFQPFPFLRQDQEAIREQRFLRHLRRRSFGHARSNPREPVVREGCCSSLLHSHRLPGKSSLLNLSFFFFFRSEARADLPPFFSPRQALSENFGNWPAQDQKHQPILIVGGSTMVGESLLRDSSHLPLLCRSRG